MISTPCSSVCRQLWDCRKKGVLQTFQNTYQVTAISFSDTAEQVFSAGIDNDVKVGRNFHIKLEQPNPLMIFWFIVVKFNWCITVPRNNSGED